MFYLIFVKYFALWKVSCSDKELFKTTINRLVSSTFTQVQKSNYLTFIGVIINID